MTIRRINPTCHFSMERGLAVTAILFAMIVVPSCQNNSGTTPQDGPVAERTSVHYMMPAIEAVHQGIADAEEVLLNDPPDTDAARKSLGKARRSLANLQWFYIPATEAREDVYNAYMEYFAGHPEESNDYLNTAKQILLQIAGQSSSEVGSYVKDLADRIETVQFQIQSGAPAHDEFRSLCARFQLHLLKAQLVLDKNAFEEQEQDIQDSSKEVE